MKKRQHIHKNQGKQNFVVNVDVFSYLQIRNLYARICL